MTVATEAVPDLNALVEEAPARSRSRAPMPAAAAAQSEMPSAVGAGRPWPSIGQCVAPRSSLDYSARAVRPAANSAQSRVHSWMADRIQNSVQMPAWIQRTWLRSTRTKHVMSFSHECFDQRMRTNKSQNVNTQKLDLLSHSGTNNMQNYHARAAPGRGKARD